MSDLTKPRYARNMKRTRKKLSDDPHTISTTISLSYIKEGVHYPGTPVTNISFNYPLRDLYVGSYPAGGHGQDAEWAEFRAYDGNMDSTQSNSKLNELATKWGL